MTVASDHQEPALQVSASTYVPPHIGPGPREAAVLSAIAARTGDDWTLVCGSLLTVPQGVARTSWKRWGELQPQRPGGHYDAGGFDLGPVSWAEPLRGLRILRMPLDRGSWEAAVPASPTASWRRPSQRADGEALKLRGCGA